jgi:hypothetical protein
LRWERCCFQAFLGRGLLPLLRLCLSLVILVFNALQAQHLPSHDDSQEHAGPSVHVGRVCSTVSLRFASMMVQTYTKNKTYPTDAINGRPSTLFIFCVFIMLFFSGYLCLLTVALCFGFPVFECSRLTQTLYCTGFHVQLSKRKTSYR